MIIISSLRRKDLHSAPQTRADPPPTFPETQEHTNDWSIHLSSVYVCAQPCDTSLCTALGVKPIGLNHRMSRLLTCALLPVTSDVIN